MFCVHVVPFAEIHWKRTAHRSQTSAKGHIEMCTGGGLGLWSAFHHSWSYRRLLVGFVGVCRCRCGDLMWTYLVWAERSTPDNVGMPSHRYNSATGEQKGITQTIYTDTAASSRMPNWWEIEPRPPAPREDALTTMLRVAVRCVQGWTVISSFL